MDPVVIVGGDAAGMSAASKLKRDAPDREVVVFERGEWVSYAACGMPYFVKGDVESLDDLVTITPEAFVEERDIDLRLRHEVTAIDTADRRVTVEAGGETFEQPYDALLIGTGARAVTPPIDGIELDGVFTLHSMDATDAIDSYLDENEVDTVGVVGGGYVGIEMAEAFTGRGCDVHLFEMLPHVLDPFGETAATHVEDHLESKGVALHLDTTVEGFVGDDTVEAVDAGGTTHGVDLVLVGVGVRPNVELAEEAGIELGPTGAIATDEYGRTSADGVFAAGDCAEATNVVTGEADYVPLALTANRAGRAIGQTIAGDPTPVGDIAGTATVKAFDLEVSRTGVIDEETAREAGFDPVSATITAKSRAHYYPGAEDLTVTLVADRETERVLGASTVGSDRAAKRIDTVATALFAEMTVSDVEYLDLAYAPPFSPVWDPVLTAAKVLRGKLDSS
ncbi:MAG: FAD-dependent oxidoreductase [Halobacteriota archaeon]